ncbi:ribonuclease H-like domain-containing protein, partial [Tanacetum coccineum]
MMKRELGEGYSFIKKKCFVCGSLSHLIKDCDYYEKKMAREAEFKKQRVFNTGNKVAKPVWTNANMVNHANHFVPRPVQLNAVRHNVNFVMPNVNTGRVNINSVRHNVNSVKTNVNTGRSKQPVPTCNSNSFSPGNWGTAVKTSAGYMTGNKDHLDDFEECKGGFVTIWIHKVLFTETECLVVSPEFKMPDENHILLKVPRQYNMYSFDMKTPSLTKDYTCLIAKATSDESKLWHRRSDNGTEFKNRDMLEFYGNKGIKQEYSTARTPQQNGVAERMNRTLIEAARTMLADSLLPTTFWAEAVSTACYIFNRVRVTKPQNKTPYELLFGHKPIISYIRPFDIDYLTDSMNYIPVSMENQANPHAGTSQTLKSNASEEKDEDVELIVVPSAVTIPEEIVDSRTSSTNSKKEKTLTNPQQEKKVSSTDTLEDKPKIQAFRRELEQIALKHLGTVPEKNTTNTSSV